MDFAQIILSPFVWLLTTFHNVFGDYGIALMVFALVVKVILFPFSLKGKKGMIQMNMLSVQMQKLQKQYGKDKERYNMEVQKLYAREKVNPMSGCLWSFLPLIVLFPLYAIIRQPLKYMMHLNSEQIGKVAEALNWGSQAMQNGWIKSSEAFVDAGYNQLFLASLINDSTVGTVTNAANSVAEGAKVFAMNFQFFGIDLSQIPQLKFWETGLTWAVIGLFLLPIISAISGLLFSFISMKTNAVNNQSAQAANNASSKMMLLMSPLMSLWIGFTMPAALCIYWISNNIFSLAQEFVASKLLKKDYAKAAAAQAEAALREKEEEKEQKRIAAEERAQRIEDAKNNKGKKKLAPKKKDEEDDKVPATVKEASRVGMRQYARGRAYDPNRFGNAPTHYFIPGMPMPETNDVKALEAESDFLEEVALEETADQLIVEAIREEQVAPDATAEEIAADSNDDGDYEPEAADESEEPQEKTQ